MGLALLAAAVLLSACSGTGPDEAAAGSTAPPPVRENAGRNPAQSTSVAATQPISDVDDLSILLAEADALEENGYWEDAAALRAGAIGDPDFGALPAHTRAETQLRQVRLQLQLEDPEAAQTALLQIRTTDLSPANGRAYHLLMARTLRDLDDVQGALAAVQRYEDAEGPAKGAAALLRARILEGAGDSAAVAAYASAADDPAAPAVVVEEALLGAAEALERAEDLEGALGRYRQLADVSPWASDDAVALERIGEISLDLGQIQAAVASWTSLLRTYPWHWRAASVYDEMDRQNLPVDGVTAGLVLYRHHRYDEARAVLLDVLISRPDPAVGAVAEYYVAAINEEWGDWEGAIAGYLVAANRDPDGALAADSLWWTARLLDQSGDADGAAAVYTRLANTYPESEFAAQAGFLAAMMPLRDGDWSTTRSHLAALAESAQDDEARQRTLIWLGKAHDAEGDSEGAMASWQAALRINPVSYYGLRAHSLTTGNQVGAVAGTSSSPRPAVAWLAEIAGDEPAQTMTDDARWNSAADLARAGLENQASSQFRSLLRAWKDEPWLLYRAGQWFAQQGEVTLALDAALALLDRLPPAQWPAAPREILRWAFPRAWLPLASEAANDHGVDPLLLYAMMRQESRFNPGAGSGAGALGLTQVMPATGDGIAQALNDDGFHVGQLYRPATSIRYGAFYLGEQLQRFDGAPWAALAAYNGGPGSALRWEEAGGLDPDTFYEAVDFRETRLYVRRVMENYAWYRYLYSEPTVEGSTLANVSVSGQ